MILFKRKRRIEEFEKKGKNINQIWKDFINLSKGAKNNIPEGKLLDKKFDLPPKFPTQKNFRKVKEKQQKQNVFLSWKN